MAEHQEIADAIREFVMRETNMVGMSIGDDVDLFRDGILDSLMAVSLMSFCEEKFGCKLIGKDISEDDMRSIGSLASMVARLQVQPQ